MKDVSNNILTFILLLIIKFSYLVVNDPPQNDIYKNSQQSYYSNFITKAKEVNLSRNNSHRSVTKMNSRDKVIPKSRNLEINPAWDIKTADKAMSSQNIPNPYGVQDSGSSTKMLVGDVRTVRDNPFKNMRFNLDMINPIIWRTSSRKSMVISEYH